MQERGKQISTIISEFIMPGINIFLAAVILFNIHQRKNDRELSEKRYYMLMNEYQKLSIKIEKLTKETLKQNRKGKKCQERI